VRSKIIDLGCGTGIITEQLISTFTYTDFHAIDFADQILAKAATRLASTNATLYTADFDNLPAATQSFDLVFSNMALHWSHHFLQTLEVLISKLNHNGMIAFSVPLSDTLHELQPYFSINPFFSAPSIVKALQKNACAVLINQQEEINLSFSNTISALKSIKKVGANTVINRDRPHYYSKSSLNKIHINKLTYRIGYFIAQKG
jgi:malonyl-CoA O-methyltransferase